MTRVTTSRHAVLWVCVGLLVLSRAQLASGQTPASPKSPPDVDAGQLSDVLAAREATADSVAWRPGDGLVPSCRDSDRAWWGRADALIWWGQGNPVPPLVTTGVLEEPGTEILFGDDRIDDAARGGVRLTLGYWLDDCRACGVEAHYAYLANDSGGGYFAESTGDPILARPFFNVGLGVQNAQLLAYPEFHEGQISVDTLSEIHSAGVLLRQTLAPRLCGRTCLGRRLPLLPSAGTPGHRGAFRSAPE